MLKHRSLCLALLFQTALFFPSCTGYDYFDTDTNSDPEEVKTFNLIGDQVLPEGIAVDQRNGDIYTGGFFDGSMQITKDGLSEFLIAPGANLLLPTVLGLSIDEKRNRIWVCSNSFGDGASRISVVDLTTKEAIASFNVDDIQNAPEPFPTFFNDVITDRFGNAYVTNSSTNSVIKVDVDLDNARVLTSDFPMVDGDSYTINGIEVTPNGKYLIVNSFRNEGGLSSRLFRVDLRSNQVISIPFSEEGAMDFALTGGDGLSFVNSRVMFCATFNNSIATVVFNKNYTEAQITDATGGTASEPEIIGCATTAVYKKKLYTTNAQVVSFFVGLPVEPPFKVVEIPFSTLIK